MQLNVTGSGISPGADGTSQSHLQDLDEQECIDSYIHHPSWGMQSLYFYIIGTHSNNVLIWFTKRILGTVFLCPYNVCPK